MLSNAMRNPSKPKETERKKLFSLSLTEKVSSRAAAAYGRQLKIYLQFHDVKNSLNWWFVSFATLDGLCGEMRQLFEVRVFVPHSLSQHLTQFHSSYGRTQPTIGTQNIDTSLG